MNTIFSKPQTYTSEYNRRPRKENSGPLVCITKKVRRQLFFGESKKKPTLPAYSTTSDAYTPRPDVVDINDIPFYKTLNQLRVGFSTYPIVGRILRLWETQNIWKNGQIIGLTFLLLDEKGDVINCFINVRRTSLYKNIIHEGLVYSINRFYVTLSNKKYKLTHTPFSITFTDTTIISQIVGNGSKIPMHKYMLRNYNDLQSLANTNKELPDIVGQIRFVEGIELNHPNSTRPIVLRLRMQRKWVVRVALWDNVAASFRKDFGIAKLQRFTILITSINPKIRQGNLVLDSTAATSIIKKPAALTTKQFKKTDKVKIQLNSKY